MMCTGSINHSVEVDPECSSPVNPECVRRQGTEDIAVDAEYYTW